MNRFLSSTLLFLVVGTLPAFAQTTLSVSGFATWVHPNGEGTFQVGEGVSDLETFEFESEQGWGAAVNFYLSNRFSTEFAASLVKPNFTTRTEDPLIPFEFTQDLEMIPITATLQFHLLGSGRIDPYIGVGAAYILYDDIDTVGELDEIDTEAIDFDDDVGYAVNAGLGLGLGTGMGLYLDAKYVPSKTSARAIFTEGPGQDQEIRIDPLIVAVGLSLRF